MIDVLAYIGFIVFCFMSGATVASVFIRIFFGEWPWDRG